MTNHPTDEALLTAVDPQAFGAFYARHLVGVERYFARRVRTASPRSGASSARAGT